MSIVKEVINLLVGLVVFVTGMNFMSNGLMECAGRSIRKLFKKIKDNRVVSALIGAGTTAIIQSSGATTVMVVAFLSAGALTFAQGFSIMLGAFIGTTVTGILVALSSFSFSVFLMLSAFIGFILQFFKSENSKSIGKILIGFGILFFGLEAMKGAFVVPEIQKTIIDFIGLIDFPFLLMIIGAVLTMLTQSSSATNGIVIVMVAANPSLLASSFCLVIGATIGALFPTILAAIRGNVLSKRVTFSILLTRIIGAILATGLIWIFNDSISNLISQINLDNGLILALFTLIYNILFVLLFINFINPMEKLSNKLVIDKDEEKKKKFLNINDNLINTPSLAIIQVKKEIERMYDLAKTNLFLGLDAILKVDLSNTKEIEEREENIDYINNSISTFLIKLSSKASLYDEAKIGAYYHVINDIERIGDHGINFLDMAKRMHSEDLSFSEIAINEFNEFKNVLIEMFNVTIEVFDNKDEQKLSYLHSLEDKTDNLKELLSNNHFNRIKKNECNNELSPFHSNLLTELERVADHLTNIGYSIVNPTGDDEVKNYAN